MAAQKYDLFGRFIFKGQRGKAQLAKVKRAFASLRKNAQAAKASVQKIGAGLRQLAIVSAGATAAIGLIVKKTMDYNKQMSVVKSVTQATGKN